MLRESLHESLTEHVLRPKLPNETIEQIISDCQKLEMAYLKYERSKNEKKDPYIDPNNYWPLIIDGLSSREKWEQFTRNAYMSEKISLDSQRVAMQQKLADQLIFNPDMSFSDIYAIQQVVKDTIDTIVTDKLKQASTKKDIENLKEIAKLNELNYAIGSSSVAGVATMFDIVSDKGYEALYPHDILDVLLKIDFASYSNNKYDFFQIKTEDELTEPYLLINTDEIKNKEHFKDMVRTIYNNRSGEDMDSLNKAREILTRFTQHCRTHYTEEFSSYFIFLPSRRSLVYKEYFNNNTGLPKKGYCDMIAL